MTYLLTKEGLEELQAELRQIAEVALPQIIEAINSALAEGDLKENSALDSAKLERDKLVARQNELEEIVSDYEIIAENHGQPSKTVKLGGQAKVQYMHDNSQFVVRIVGSSEANAIEGRISNESPLAQAILGKQEGQEAKFKTKNGNFIIKIVEIIS